MYVSHEQVDAPQDVVRNFHSLLEIFDEDDLIALMRIANHSCPLFVSRRKVLERQSNVLPEMCAFYSMASKRG
jgi:hypothetical protein